MGRTTLAKRVVVRVGVQVWRSRLTWLGAGVTATALTAFQVGAARAPAATMGGDCADTVMQMIVAQTPETARAAYHCLSGATPRVLTEEQFVQQAQGGVPRSAHVTRVGERRAPDGQTVVYFALDGAEGTLVYSVYEGPDGKVVHVE